MDGLMQRAPLLVSALAEHAEREHAAVAVVSRRSDGETARTTYGGLFTRARRLATALRALGVAPGDRVATLAWNTDRHMELYFATSGIGAVCHTVNPRLFDPQVTFIVNDGGARVLFVDLDLLPLVERCAAGFEGLERVVALCRADQLPPTTLPPSISLLAYEPMVEAAEPLASWPDLGEESAAMLCYTSGTTGMPKGVLYSQRSIVLHTYGICMVDALGFSARDCVLPIVPMFHVMAWGLPYAAAAVGFKLVMPANRMDGAALQSLILEEGVTCTAGVPTVWLGLHQHLQQHGGGLGALSRIISGGAAISTALVETFRREHKVRVQHAWGMTELSPVAGVNSPRADTPLWPDPAYDALQSKQGRAPFGLAIKVVGDDGAERPRDGLSVGHIKVKGAWVAAGYYKHPELPVLDADGWFATGDIGTLDPAGFLQITDRAKDAIKSGGEWISTLELENIAHAHPAVLEAAAIGVPDARWDERPLLVCVLKPGAEASGDEVRAFFHGKVARWCIPDAVVFAEALPHSATGKLDKVALRRQFATPPAKA